MGKDFLRQRDGEKSNGALASGREERPAPECSVCRRLRRANTLLEPKGLRPSAQPRAVRAMKGSHVE